MTRFIDRKVVLIFRADERRRESGPTKLAPPKRRLVRGSAQERSLV
jgi:hypothetical protein